MDNLTQYVGLTGSQIYELAQKEYFKELRSFWNDAIEYYPKSGEFYYKTAPKFCEPAGYNANGYVIISYQNQTIRAHRLAFLIMTGSIPEFIDHNDQNRANNVWDNLNKSSPAHNAKNQTKAKNNTSGFTGVYQVGDKWTAKIMIDGRLQHLGTFDTIMEAYAVRRQADFDNGYNINHGKVPFKEPQFTERAEVLAASKRMTDND